MSESGQNKQQRCSCEDRCGASFQLATDQVTAPPRNKINSRRLIAAPDGTLKGHAAYQPAPVVWKGFRSAACPLWANGGHSVTASLSIRQQDRHSCIRQDVLGCPAKYP